MDECTVFTSIIGKPNMGKSTLLNRLVGVKIAITSQKPQTTRQRIMGVLTENGCQYVFCDTPGYHKPRTRLGEHMMKTVEDSVSDVDAALFLTYPKPFLDDEEQLLFGSVKSSGVPVILVVNKIDTASSKKKAEECAKKLAEDYDFDASALVSAATGEGCQELLKTLRGYAANGPHMFDDDTLTDQPERVLAAEFVREQLLNELRDELPHGCAVVTEEFTERSNGIIDVSVLIMCERESHKGMIIGKGGSMLKRVGTAARIECEGFFGQKVNLMCHVKVKEGWRNSESTINYLGY